MAVNIPHCFKVYEIIFHLIPVRLVVILKTVFPVYLRIEEITVLHRTANHIYIIPGFPFICLYALLPVNENRIAGLLDIMSRSFLLGLLPFIFTLLVHGAIYHLIVSNHINQVCMVIYVFLRQLTIDKETVMFRVGYKKPVLCHCHKAVTHTFPAIGILVGIKTYRRF